MSLNNGITVRLDPGIRDRLEAVATHYGVKASVLIRQAVIEKLDAIDAQSAVVITAPAARAAGREGSARAKFAEGTVAPGESDGPDGPAGGNSEFIARLQAKAREDTAREASAREEKRRGEPGREGTASGE